MADKKEPLRKASLPVPDAARVKQELLQLMEGVTIAELANPIPDRAYDVVPVAEIIDPMVESNDVLIVAGGFFGDEGKGKTVNALATHPKISVVARVNSGENAGHTVKVGTSKFIFNLCPSGVICEPYKVNIVGSECVMDPITFMSKEVSQLVAAGVPYKGHLFVGNVHIVTPYHKLMDALGSDPNSSTLKGMSPAHASKVTKRGIRLEHIYGETEVLQSRLKRDMESYNGMLLAKGLSDQLVRDICKALGPKIPQHIWDFLDAQDKVQFLVDLYYREVRDNPNFPTFKDTGCYLRNTLAKGEKVLLEGPQSYWLSNTTEKFWPGSTSADSTAAGLIAAAGINLSRYRISIVNIHKAPASSRVGSGSCPSSYVPQNFFSACQIGALEDMEGLCDDFDAIQDKWAKAVLPCGIIDPTATYADKSGEWGIGGAMAVASSKHHFECGATTKRPRVCGVFDAVSCRQMIDAQGPYMSVSAIDRGDDYDLIGVAVAYVYYHPTGATTTCHGIEYRNGTIVRIGDPFPTESVLFNCHPIIRLVEGFKGTPLASGARKPLDSLPPRVKRFVALIEELTSSHVISIGNGPRQDEILYLRRAQ